MDALVESIKSNGILEPLKVRSTDKESCYEVISGHRRLYAAKKIGLTSVPVKIYTMSKEEAAIVLVDSNLHREHILPSEKAKAYKLKMDALKHQGKTSDQVGPKLSAEEISKDDSATQVKRYIRLTNLISPILDMLDEGRIAFTPAVELSYLQPDEQQYLLETIELEDKTPSLSQSVELKKLSQMSKLNREYIFSLLSKEKPNQKDKISIQLNELKKYFPKNYTPQDIHRRLIELAKRDYQQRERGAR